jgi:hypothetical protein
MTRQHFQMIADVLKDAGQHNSCIDRTAHEAIAREFAVRLMATNPRFDRARFLKACGVEA